MSDLAYLDNNASTRVDPRVLEAMLPYFSQRFGNPSSMHQFGASVAARVEEARGQVAAALGARDSEIVFTSGGTEADNAALHGVLAARPHKRHVVISSVEHHAVFEYAEQLEHDGYAVTRVRVDRDGRLDLAHLAESIRDDTALVSVMLVNNETGVVLPVREVCEIAARRGVPVHSDAVNALGKLPISVDELGVALLSISAHKVYGPKGVGALYVRRGTSISPLIIGGSQERRRRGGTLNAPGIIGLGAACALLCPHDEAEARRQRRLRDRLEAGLIERFDNAHIVGQAVERVGNTCCACFAGVGGEALVLLLSEAGVCVSSGAACSSGSLEPSHVLKAMGFDGYVGQGQTRFSVGRFSTDADVDRALAVLPELMRKVAALNRA